jgi:peptidoglycan/LPS O-acetylase OafA/YrhL
MKQLDGLRAMAVLAVLWTHYLPEEYWLFGIYWGGYGVRLFFVLSGFLITGILLKSRQSYNSGKTMLIFCYAPVLHQKILANFSFILCNISISCFNIYASS